MIAKAEAERRRLIDVEKAKVAAESVNSAAPVDDPVPADQKSKVRAKGKAAEAPVEPVVAKTIEQVVQQEVGEGKLTPVGPAPKERKPYNPEKLSSAAEPGKAPKKGQLPAGLIAYLAKKHAGSQIIAATAGAAPTKKGKKAKK